MSTHAPKSTAIGRVIVLLGTCSAAFGCAGGTGGNPPTASELQADVDAFLGTYMDAIEARDTEALRGQLADSGRYVWAEEGMVRYRSVDQMLEGLSSFPADMLIETEVSNLEVVRVGMDGAHAALSFTTRIGEGQGAFSFGGLMTFVLERHDETWRIVAGHVSSPRSDERRTEN